jgi:hypothetical protein
VRLSAFGGTLSAFDKDEDKDEEEDEDEDEEGDGDEDEDEDLIPTPLTSVSHIAPVAWHGIARDGFCRVRI